MRLACVTPGLCLLAALCVLLPGCSGAGHSACNSSTDCAGGGMCVDQSCVSSLADAGASDAGQPGDGGLDGATSDGGVDAGSPDAGGLDAGDSDAGSWDAGESDAGVIDAGNSDAGASDAGGGVVPAAPTSVLATAEDDEALVVWTAPAANGGPAITGYVVTGSPGGSATTTGSTRVAVVGLTAGTPYTFTVAARNSAGEGPASAPSSAVTPWECNPVTDTEGDSANCPTGQVCGLNELCANAAYTPSSGTVADAVTGLIWQQTVTGLKGCNRPALSPSGKTMALSCEGQIDMNGNVVSLAESAVALFDVTTLPPKALQRFAISDQLTNPTQDRVSFASETLLVGKTQTALGGTASNQAFSLDTTTGKATVLLTAGLDAQGMGKGIVYGDFVCSPGCAGMCLLADADVGKLQRWTITAGGLELQTPLAMDPTVGLPPVGVAGY